LGDHLAADAEPATGRMHGEVEDVQLGLVQLVDHEADDLFTLLGHHADAVALAQAAKEVFFGPGELEAFLLGLEDFGHVTPDHPPDVDADLFLVRTTRVHQVLLPSPRCARSPLRGCATPPLLVPFDYPQKPTGRVGSSCT